MKKSFLPIAGGVAFAALAGAQTNFTDSSAVTVANGIGVAPELSEIRIDQPGSDIDEYVEIFGTPGTDLTGMTLLVIGEAGSDGAGGGLDAVVDLSGIMIPASGYLVLSEDTFTLGTADVAMPSNFLNFENSDNVTFLLVDGFTGAAGDDMDVDDDGILDGTNYTTLLDSIALVESVGSGDLFYGPNTVGPDGTFVPGQVSKCMGVWGIGEFGVGPTDTPGYDNCAPGVFVTFCDPAENNSTGGPVTISGAFGTGVGSNLHLDAAGGPDTEFGYFLVGTAPETMSPLPISNGFLCLSTTGGNVFGRYNVTGPLNSIGAFDMNGDLVNAVGTSVSGLGYDVDSTIPLGSNPMITSGDTWHFQLWYRDGAAGVGSSNLSNGLSVTF